MAETPNVHVILGNSALFSCNLPSFVVDLVSVDAWLDSEGEEFFSGDYGRESWHNRKTAFR